MNTKKKNKQQRALNKIEIEQLNIKNNYKNRYLNLNNKFTGYL